MIDIVSCDSAPERSEVDDILHEYYTYMFSAAKRSGLAIDPADGIRAAAEFWDKIDLYLPPSGRTYLARDDEGRLLGIGMLKKIRADAGEMKRLFVRPEARGTGLGRRLVEIRMEAARQMGLKTLLVDTLKTTREMQGLYDSLGFRRIEIYPESSAAKVAPHLVKHLLFFEKEL